MGYQKNSVNEARILGNIGNKPQLDQTEGGASRLRLSIATTYVKTPYSDEGEALDTEEVTTWHNVIFYGKVAERLEQFATQGLQLYVKGKNAKYSYENDDGETRYFDFIRGEDFVLPPKGSAAADINGGQTPSDEVPF